MRTCFSRRTRSGWTIWNSAATSRSLRAETYSSNRLALIAPADSKIELKIEPGFPLASALGSGRLATGDPDIVPVGRYARGALTSLGVWNDVADRLVRAEDVRTRSCIVARGEVPLGIVYATDARVEKRVRLVGLFPAESHLPITYPVALTTRAGQDAARFVDFVRSDTARAIRELRLHRSALRRSTMQPRVVRLAAGLAVILVSPLHRFPQQCAKPSKRRSTRYASSSSASRRSSRRSSTNRRHNERNWTR